MLINAEKSESVFWLTPSRPLCADPYTVSEPRTRESSARDQKTRTAGPGTQKHNKTPVHQEISVLGKTRSWGKHPCRGNLGLCDSRPFNTRAPFAPFHTQHRCYVSTSLLVGSFPTISRIQHPKQWSPKNSLTKYVLAHFPSSIDFHTNVLGRCCPKLNQTSK